MRRGKLLGDEAEIAVGIGQEAVYLAVGRDNLEAVKKAIDASAAEPSKAVPPFELAISLGPIMEMAAAEAHDADKKKVSKQSPRCSATKPRAAITSAPWAS